MRKLLLAPLTLVTVLTAVAFVAAAGAAPVQFSVPIHADEDQLPVGSTLTNTVAVPGEAQGRTCTVSTQNGESVHTGASVTFTSASSVTLSDTEGASHAQRSGSITLGATITATAVVGQDPAYEPGLGGFSLGAAAVDCPDVPTTTTVAPPTTTRPAPPGVVVVKPGFTG